MIYDSSFGHFSIVCWGLCTAQADQGRLGILDLSIIIPHSSVALPTRRNRKFSSSFATFSLRGGREVESPLNVNSTNCLMTKFCFCTQFVSYTSISRRQTGQGTDKLSRWQAAIQPCMHTSHITWPHWLMLWNWIIIACSCNQNNSADLHGYHKASLHTGHSRMVLTSAIF